MELLYIHLRSVKFLGLNALDHEDFPINRYFTKAANYIHHALHSHPHARVMVHCVQGLSRSATLVLAYLVIKMHYTVEKALTQVVTRRHITPNPGFLLQLVRLQRGRESAQERHWGDARELLRQQHEMQRKQHELQHRQHRLQYQQHQLQVEQHAVQRKQHDAQKQLGELLGECEEESGEMGELQHVEIHLAGDPPEPRLHTDSPVTSSSGSTAITASATARKQLDQLQQQQHLLQQQQHELQQQQHHLQQQQHLLQHDQYNILHEQEMKIVSSAQ